MKAYQQGESVDAHWDFASRRISIHAKDNHGSCYSVIKFFRTEELSRLWSARRSQQENFFVRVFRTGFFHDDHADGFFIFVIYLN